MSDIFIKTVTHCDLLDVDISFGHQIIMDAWISGRFHNIDNFNNFLVTRVSDTGLGLIIIDRFLRGEDVVELLSLLFTKFDVYMAVFDELLLTFHGDDVHLNNVIDEAIKKIIDNDKLEYFIRLAKKVNLQYGKYYDFALSYLAVDCAKYIKSKLPEIKYTDYSNNMCHFNINQRAEDMMKNEPDRFVELLKNGSYNINAAMSIISFDILKKYYYDYLEVIFKEEYKCLDNDNAFRIMKYTEEGGKFLVHAYSYIFMYRSNGGTIDALPTVFSNITNVYSNEEQRIDAINTLREKRNLMAL